ncbi:CoA ester lyase [Pelagibius sp. Alg239-R121]|uniref:HpcH/HpaI aldolase/citrate lyase family protein n=1 Tax=Pelagibius sp. Alg239-R121 TaxID=2993448 RepID=UPI0024A6BE78|nr:CoA ester lyase [Pelagibius sp. Alg239-R121]
MSFTIVEQATARLNRSELAVPGSSPQFFEKAAKSAADVIFLDLEDAVAPDDKAQARKNIIEGLNDLDWGDKTISVRINGLDTHYMYRDVVDIIEQGGERLDMIMIPKVGTAADVYALDMLVTQVEDAVARKKKIGFEMIIETALGMANVDAIAAASKRNESLHFGVADYAASTKARTTVIGGPNANYGVLTDKDGDAPRDYHWGDMWHYAVARMVVAARAHGLRPIDGPFGDFSDPDGFKAQAYRAAVLGCEGKWAIHPSQVDIANEVNSPSEKEITQAQRILDAMKQAQAEGKGAVSLDGRLIDIASIKQAEVMVKKAEQIAAAG